MAAAGREVAICDAALALLLEVGYDRMSMDAVAARARASKATIYRRWPGKQELVLDAVRARGPGLVVTEDTGSLRGDLVATYSAARHGSAADDADLIAGVLRAMRSTPELADCIRTEVVESKCDVEPDPGRPSRRARRAAARRRSTARPRGGQRALVPPRPRCRCAGGRCLHRPRRRRRPPAHAGPKQSVHPFDGDTVTDPNRPSGEALDGAHSASAVEPDPKRWLALAVLAAAQLMIVLDASIVNIALPSAQADLGITNANRQWMVTAYTLAFGGLLLLGGRIADYTGRKRTFIIGLLGFAGASALGGFAPNQELLFAARALQGGVRRADGARRAVHRHRDVHRPEGARQGVRRLRRARRRWRGDRPDRRRRPHRVRLVALVPRRQRARRADRRRLPRSRSCTRARPTATPATTSPACCSRRSAWCRSSTASPRPPAPRTRATRPTRRCRAGPPRRRSPSSSPPSCCSSRSCGGRRRAKNPMLPLRVVLDRNRGGSYLIVPAGRCRAVRDVPVPHVLLPDQPGLQPAQVRLRLPAVQRGHHPDGRRGGAAAPTVRARSRSWSRASSWRWSACCCSRRSRRTRRTGRTSCPPSCS